MKMIAMFTDSVITISGNGDVVYALDLSNNYEYMSYNLSDSFNNELIIVINKLKLLIARAGMSGRIFSTREDIIRDASGRNDGIDWGEVYDWSLEWFINRR
jgi:hypothetical protein